MNSTRSAWEWPGSAHASRILVAMEDSDQRAGTRALFGCLFHDRDAMAFVIFFFFAEHNEFDFAADREPGQQSGVAEPVGTPGLKWVPGSSSANPTCSGIMPPAFEKPSIALINGNAPRPTASL